MKTITMDELQAKLKKLGKNEIILDVRTEEEFKEAHIPGSINQTHEEIDKIADQLKKYDHVFIHCRSGKRAQVAFQRLNELGLNNLVCIKDGGMMNWLEAGYEVEKG
jgi:rhodanese-related sulfurtransferase